MKKFNWDEFKNKDNKIAVHCKTEEEAKDFCRQMHEHGMKWCTGNSYMEKTNYKKYKGGTCYVGFGMFSSYRYYNIEGYTILEWSDYMHKEFTKADLKDGMAVEYNDNCFGKRLVVGGFLIGEDGYADLGDHNENLKSAVSDLEIVRPLINDFLRKMAKFRHQENQDVSAGTRIRFFIDKPAAMISFPRAVIKYL